MEQKIWFTDSGGNKLCSFLSNPTKSLEKPVFIICHGLSSNKNSPIYSELTDILKKHNISTFKFDFYGHGESQGNFDDITVSKAVDSILQAIKLLKELGYKKIGLIGTSFGGISSIIAASKTKSLFLLVLRSPVSNYKVKTLTDLSNEEMQEWKTSGYRVYTNVQGKRLRLNYSFYEDLKNNDGYKAAKKIKIPTLIVHGDRDDVVPIEQSNKLSKIITKAKLIRIIGADHFYSDKKNFNEMLKVISDYVIQKSK
ncbi:MAG: alpha/beta fold hydrolase [Candidatus Aenigmarchaeota archaeon]|nr:alpha/beta fold hydrolase [Candidatus Aenigmarchaeota archaeon]